MLYIILFSMSGLYLFLSLMIAIFNCRVNYILGNVSTKKDIAHNMFFAFLLSPIAIAYMFEGLRHLEIKYKEDIIKN